MKIYQVGGAVRDRLMHRTPQDIDYVVISSSPDEMIQAGFKPVGKNFPVFIHPQNKYEYALARKEIKIGNKHTDFQFIFDKSVTLDEDLLRRDFTCNALAFDEDTSQIIDIFNGINDIKNKILRHINSQHFVEDPLRILRMCRFAAQLNFSVAPETMRLAQNMVSDGLLQYLPAERIWQEIFKALQTDNFELFIETSLQCGALYQILPEIAELFTVSTKHDNLLNNNLGKRTLLALNQVRTSKPLIKFAVLLHNIKTFNKDCNLNKSNTINQICKRLRIPNNYKKFANLCYKYHNYISQINELDSETLVNFVDEITKYEINDFIDVCRASYLGYSQRSSEHEFQQKVSYFMNIVKKLNNIKATSLPDFNNIPKDQTLALKLKKIKINILNNLTKK